MRHVGVGLLGDVGAPLSGVGDAPGVVGDMGIYVPPPGGATKPPL